MEIGNKLNLFIKDFESEKMIEYRCTIIGIDHDCLLIDYPIHKETQRTGFFPNGTVLLATYIDQDKNLYQFRTKIQKRITLTIPGLAIDIPKKEEIKQIQRREYVRIMTAVDIAIHPIDDSFSPFTTVTNDISGGGMSIIIPHKIKLKEKQTVIFTMVLHLKSKIKYVHLQGEIIRIYQQNKEFRTASIRFISITDKIRQLIIQFVFEKQREARNKGVI
ncbi:MAG TPA: flagellar brake domain-containing protein [Candidatus Dormibacteraeota bacterium]|nr:flagellar brake domain-containing protein [Candidatus Dormibacteraeota bacterium]